jgi:hypothetical protein
MMKVHWDRLLKVKVIDAVIMCVCPLVVAVIVNDFNLNTILGVIVGNRLVVILLPKEVYDLE